ncbi:MAG: hypothetical protein K5694_05150 [Bacilli bacterium]|nr:hypothetical protein [Bacilli bacterium]
MTPAEKRLGFLGLLYKSHKALIGEEIRFNLPKIRLLILPKGETSRNIDNLLSKAKSSNIEIIQETYSKIDLGRSLGHEEVALVAITDKKAALAYLNKTKGEQA